MNSQATTPLPRRLAAVAMTYTTRPLFYWATGFGLVLLCLTAPSIARQPKPIAPAMLRASSFYFSTGPLFFGIVIVLHAKAQFVTPAARLVPGYRTPHLAAFALLAMIFLSLGQLVVAYYLGLAPIGSAALAICVGSLCALFHHYPLLAILFLPAAFSMWSPDVSRFWMDPALPLTPIRLTLLAAGWWGFAMWLKRIATLHEERSDYVIPPTATSVLRPSRSARAEQRKFAARQLNSRRWQVAWLLDPRIDRALASRPPLAPTELVRLGLGPYSALTTGVYLGVLFGGMWIAMAEWWGVPRESIAAQLLLIGSVAPAFLVFVQIDEKRSRLEGDLVRPMKRDAFYTALLGGYLRDLAVVAGVFILTAMMIAACYFPQRLSVATAIAFAAQIAASNLIFAAVNLYLASRFGALPRMAILFLPIVGMIALNFFLWQLLVDYGVRPILACSLVYAALAALTLRAAHRRWLNTEVG